MPTIGETSENARANADLSVKSRTGVFSSSDFWTGIALASAMSVPFWAWLLVVRGSACDGRRGRGHPVSGLRQHGAGDASRRQPEGRGVRGHIADRGDPDTTQGVHPVEEPVQHLRPGGAPGHERVAAQRESGAQSVHRLEFERPHLEHLGRALDHARTDEVGQERVLLPVVQPPPHRDLHQRRLRRGVRNGEHVRVVGVHEAGVVQEAPVCQELRGVPVHLPHRRPVTQGANAGDIAQGLQAQVDHLRLDLFRHPDGVLVEIAVMRDLVTGLCNRSHHVGIPVSRVTGREEGRPYTVARQDRQDPRHSHQRAVRLVAHRRHAVDRVDVRRQHGGLGVQVEGEAGGRAVSRRPPDGFGHAGLTPQPAAPVSHGRLRRSSCAEHGGPSAVGLSDAGANPGHGSHTVVGTASSFGTTRETMAISVRELLQLPYLRAELLAGAGGIDAQVTWVHTSDLPNPWEWQGPGELLLTNGTGLLADPDGQVDFVERLAACGASGLAIGLGMPGPALTPQLLSRADELTLPVLTVPFSVPFTSMVRAVAAANDREESQQMLVVARLYELLRQSIAAGSTGPGLLQRLGRELGVRLYLVDPATGHSLLDDGDDNPYATSLAAGYAQHGQALPGVLQLTPDGDAGVPAIAVAVPAARPTALVVESFTGALPGTVLLQHAAAGAALELAQLTAPQETPRRAGAEFPAQMLDRPTADAAANAYLP